MPLYKCFVAGENFPGSLVGEKKPIGFYTIRVVEASSPEEAESIVLANLKNEEKLALPLGHPRPKDARVYFEKIEKVRRLSKRPKDTGFVFYVMES